MKQKRGLKHSGTVFVPQQTNFEKIDQEYKELTKIESMKRPVTRSLAELNEKDELENCDLRMTKDKIYR